MMTKTFSKHTTKPHFKQNAMININIPDIVTEKAYRHRSKSINLGTAATYKFTLKLLEPALIWLGKTIEPPFSAEDSIPLAVFMVDVKSLKRATV